MESFTNIFDSHAHYDDKKFDNDRDDILKNLFNNGICNIINVGADLASSQNSKNLANKYEKIYFACGVHPHEVENLPSNYLEIIESLAGDKKCVAIGEIGLDYFYDFSPREIQKEAFKQQLILAKKLQKPVIIHSRDASQDSLNILTSYKPCGVVHCFTQSAQTAKKIIDIGMYIGITGVVTFKNAKKVIEVVENIPVDKLLLETDCPYMAPEPNRGKRCDSSMIRFTAQAIAKIKKIDTQKLIDICNENTLKCFNIKK
ncbi:MAG: TatD family hydrolase [Oscillospiraceae bacterium]